MCIWYNKSIRLEDLAPMLEGTMSETLGMEWVEMGDDYLKMRMPVDNRTKQPYGLLHGGANCSLAETVASVGSQLVVDPKKFGTVGIEINANHIQSARDGFVTAVAKPLHLGSTTHVWDIRISDDKGKMICICRLTLAVLNKAF